MVENQAQNKTLKLNDNKKSNVRIEARDDDGKTKLHNHALSFKAAQKYILQGANVDAKDEYGRTPLHYAKNKDVVDLLIKAGADVKVRAGNGDRPLDVASRLGDKEIVDLLIKAGAEVNAKDRLGFTLLHSISNKEIVDLLIKAGANVNSKSRSGLFPLHFARDKGVIDLLIIAGANVDAKSNSGKSPLHSAVRVEKVKLLIEAGANVNTRDKRGATPLHYARDKQVVDLLIKAGAEVNSKTLASQSSLHFVKEKEVAALLINAGADVNAENSFGQTPLFFSDDASIVDLLIKKGAKVNVQDVAGLLPLNFAYDKQKKALLIKAGAHLGDYNINGQAPLFNVNDTKDVRKMAELLVGAGANPFFIRDVYSISSKVFSKFYINLRDQPYRFYQFVEGNINSSHQGLGKALEMTENSVVKKIAESKLRKSEISERDLDHIINLNGAFSESIQNYFNLDSNVEKYIGNKTDNVILHDDYLKLLRTNAKLNADDKQKKLHEKAIQKMAGFVARTDNGLWFEGDKANTELLILMRIHKDQKENGLYEGAKLVLDTRKKYLQSEQFKKDQVARKQILEFREKMLAKINAHNLSIRNARAEELEKKKKNEDVPLEDSLASEKPIQGLEYVIEKPNDKANKEHYQ